MATKTKTVKVRDSKMSAVLEPEPVIDIIGEPVFAHTSEVPTPTDDEVQDAYATRSELQKLHEGVVAQRAAVAAKRSAAENKAASIAADVRGFDAEAFSAAREVVRSLVDEEEGLESRASSIFAKGQQAEAELNRVLAVRNAAQLAKEVEQFSRDVQENERRYIAAIKDAWNGLGAAEPTLDAVSWIGGGAARVSYLTHIRELNGRAQSLLTRGGNVSSPYQIGTGVVRQMIAGDAYGGLNATFVEALVDVNP